MHEKGLSCFRLFSFEEIDVSNIAGTCSVGKFSDLNIFGDYHAYAILQGIESSHGRLV